MYIFIMIIVNSYRDGKIYLRNKKEDIIHLVLYPLNHPATREGLA